MEKNTIKGDLSNIGSVKVGDEIHYHGTAHPLPKELTLSIPKTHPAEIVGREEDLKALHACLNNQKRVVVVNGIGGIGKTTLVQVYISQYYEDYTHIVWITQNQENVTLDFINTPGLLKNLGIDAAGAEPEQLFEEVIRQLKGIPEKPNLLIIDNAVQSLAQYRNILPSQPLWHLLVTSREEITGFHLQALGFLNEERAIELFNKYYTLQKLHEQDIKELIATVDYHTLTIEILAKIAAVYRYELPVLKKAIELDLKANIEVGHYSQPVERIGSYLRTVFNISQLTDNEIWLLKQFACLPGEFHTYDLLSELLLSPESAYTTLFPELMAILAKKGWLLQNKETDSYKMHPIIAEVVKSREIIQPADIHDLMMNLRNKLLIDVNVASPVKGFMWVPFGRLLLPHLENAGTHEAGLFYNELAVMLLDLGDYDEAISLWEKVVKMDEQHFGEEHYETAMSYFNLGGVLEANGRYDEALVLLKKALKIREKTYGENHPQTIISYSNVGSVLMSSGDLDGAQFYMEKAVQLGESTEGLTHRDLIVCFTNLATLLNALMDFDGALYVLKKIMTSCEEQLGEEHPSTQTAYANVAAVLGNMGKHEESRPYSEKSIRISEKNYGTNHPSTIESYINHAVLLRSVDDPQGAIQLMNKVVAFHESRYGPEHAETSASYSFMASVYYQMEEYAKAKPLLEKAVAINEKNFGKKHTETAITYNNLASVLYFLKEYKEALRIVKKAMAIEEANYPKGDPNRAGTKSIYDAIIKKIIY